MKTLHARLVVSFCMIALGACATLGPTPATTGVSAVPSPRPGAELGLGFVPGYYLSQAVTDDPHGDAIPQASALLDVGAAIGAPGLIVAGRAVGESGDTQVEPMLGYRRVLGADRRVAVAGIVHATHASTTRESASYEVSRGGVELVGDARLNDNRWAEVHLFGTGSLGFVDATGSYCSSGDGAHGVDCPAPGEAPGPRRDGETSGVYPSGSVGLAIDLLGHGEGAFHGARLSASIGAGLMPHVVSGQDDDPRPYASAGLALTIGFGASR